VTTFLWVLGVLALVVTVVAIVAGALTLGRLGAAMGLLGSHIARTLRQMGFDLVRVIGGTVVALVLLPVTVYRLALQDRKAAEDLLGASRREATDALHALYRFAIVGPLRLVGLGGVIGHVATRVPAALEGRHGARNAAIEFEGYTILRELQAGGSGARLFVCEPDARTRVRIGLAEGEVVIKSFDFDDGTGLAEMLRESRALDAARRLGLILDHDSSERRFHYAMRYYPGLDLGKYARRLHEHAPEGQPDRGQFLHLAALAQDLVSTLRDWHELGLWHKDVKPENIIVHDGRATLIDLSLVTPLASQMTLTTHGTEYFRDPEMVRQALRGTRVSEVDAARFDIYGAGAVLHFMLEGTFPAHGVLSGFRKQSPECLRWIARRAMADFDRRYASAAEMVRDLEYAIAGGDPWAVRPADLPSMRSHAERAHDAGSGSAVGSTGAIPPVAHAGTRGTAAVGIAARTAIAPPPDAGLALAPVFRVVNWWTGAYELVSERPAPASIPAQSKRSIVPPLAILLAAIVVLGLLTVLMVSLAT
jgi:hypothetical protein